jgi:radical SAM protein with 4Fe4S-binding SPASM domain
MPESFGKLGEISLRELTINPRFTKLWKTRKDDINTCKDCEFRYICSDCRAFVQSENKPLKCNYNPYIANWE